MNSTFLTRKTLGGSKPQKLAQGRNLIVRTVLETFADWDYFMMIAFDISVIPRAIQNSDIWEGTAFLSEEYYDWWALRSEPYQRNYWADTGEYRKLMMRRHNGVFKTMQEDEFLPVLSAFNVMFVYKMQMLQGNEGMPTYGTDNWDDWMFEDGHKYGRGDCEHVHFHRTMRLKPPIARLMISGMKVC